MGKVGSEWGKSWKQAKHIISAGSRMYFRWRIPALLSLLEYYSINKLLYLSVFSPLNTIRTTPPPSTRRL